MRKSFALIGLPLFLGACGLPPAVSVASWAIDGFSYIVSGKSVTDHAISEIAQQDCALLRVVQGRQVCELEADTDETVDGTPVMVAAAPSGDNWSLSAELPPPSDPLRVPSEFAGLVAGFGPGVVAVDGGDTPAAFVPAAATWTPLSVRPRAGSENAAPEDRPAAPIHHTGATPATATPHPAVDTSADPVHTVAVVGSFKSIENAWARADRFSALAARVRTDRVDGETWHRVVADAPLRTVQRLGVHDAWLLRVCDADGHLPPCGPMTVSSTGVVAPRLASAN